MKNSLIIVGFFSLGVFLGVGRYLPEVVVANNFSMYALYVLTLFIGIGIGADKNSWNVIKKINLRIALVPVSIVIGTLIGASSVSLFLPDLKLNEVVAVSFGFGYYSLTSLYIREISGDTLGVIALVSNILREIFTLVLTPLMVKYFGKLAGIASGGATSMDTTLSVIVKYTGKEWAMISLFSGIVLTLVVPFLVTFTLEVFR
ncbi:MAG: lysine exporter LysO family protein [Paludibacter sp.]|nr:MAG: lysine exporter LysO family protein [Paludibacter sp.]